MSLHPPPYLGTGLRLTVAMEMAFHTSQDHSECNQEKCKSVGRDVTLKVGSTGGSRAPGLLTGFGAGVPKGAPRAEQGLLRLVSPSWVIGILLVARCCTGLSTL